MRFDSMLPYVLTSLDGCPESVIVRNLRLAAIEFFERTGVWTETLRPLVTTAGITVHPLPLTVDADVARLVEVALDDEPVDELVDIAEAARRVREAPVGGSFAWLIGRRDIGVWPLPAAEQALSVDAVLKPSLDAYDVPDEYAAHHVEAIAQGALARLLRMPRTPWRSLEDAAVARAEFDKAITDAAGMAGVGHVQGRLRVRPA